MLCGPAAIDENIVLRPVRQIVCYAAKVGKALLDGGKVHRVGQDGRRHRAGGQLGETVGRAAAIEEIVVAVGEAVAPRHHPQEIQRHVGGAADADGFAFEIAKARMVRAAMRRNGALAAAPATIRIGAPCRMARSD